MNIIAIYDISCQNNNSNKIRKLLSKYLYKVQLSVFEGHLENYELKILYQEINKLIDKKEDSVIIYEINSNNMNKKIIGINKNDYNDL